MPDIKTAIIGSWQIYEQGLEVVVHDEHICIGNANNTTSAQTSTIVKWENASSFEQKNFKQDGNYTHYLKSDQSCEGTYKIDDNDILVVKSNCQNYSEKIIELTNNFLTFKVGYRFFKYRKVN